MDKRGIKEVVKIRVEKMMDDTINNRRFVYVAPFRVVYPKCLISSMLIGFASKCFV
jgi:hypothetical protein